MYLAELSIRNFRGIKSLDVEFESGINVIIGENGSCKSALIDAIRLLYNLGEQRRDIFVSDDDFHIDVDSFDVATDQVDIADSFSISYCFRDLSDKQKGALHEYMVVETEPENDYAQITISYERREDKSPSFTYHTGKIEGQKADSKTFELFQHYYLDALRDSTRNLLQSNRSILSRLIQREIGRHDSFQEFETILSTANKDLLQRKEVTTARGNINQNLKRIYGDFDDGKIGVQIQSAKTDNIVNLIRPFLPFDKDKLEGLGMSLNQNSLGFNNLVYIATVLGDISKRAKDDELSHFALLIEEPEAHLHPQLQLNLYNFLKTTKDHSNSQLFVTTHSPTLASKIPLDHLILLDQLSLRVSECFEDREKEAIIQDTTNGVSLRNPDYEIKKKQLERYLDVTRSQLFFAKGSLLVEGISEILLIPAFCALLGYELEDSRIELVDTKGTSFYPFLCLYNSSNIAKRLNHPIAVITDDDRFTDSKDTKYSFRKIIKDEQLLLELHNRILSSAISTRVANLESFKNSQPHIMISASHKTLEYEIARANIGILVEEIENNFFVSFLAKREPKKFAKVKKYWQALNKDPLDPDEQAKIAILFWKMMPSKADFAYDFAYELRDLVRKSNETPESNSAPIFMVPKYIQDALSHVRS